MSANRNTTQSLDRSANCAVIYRDRHYLAAHKPHGIPTYRESRNDQADGCKEILEEKLNQRLFPVHRIDADTSGLVLFALDSKSAAAMIQLFKRHQIQKTYTAWVHGSVEAQGSIRKSLKKNKSTLMESARTDYERVKSANGKSMVKVYPQTGRYHQIRRHFQMLGHPIIGDPVYGPKTNDGSRSKSKRLMLQAEALEFIHPFTKHKIVIRTKMKL